MYLMLPFLEYRVFFSAFWFLVGCASAAHRAGRRDRSAYSQRGNIGNIANICLVSMGYAATNGFECSKCYLAIVKNRVFCAAALIWKLFWNKQTRLDALHITGAIRVFGQKSGFGGLDINEKVDTLVSLLTRNEVPVDEQSRGLGNEIIFRGPFSPKNWQACQYRAPRGSTPYK